MLTVIIIALIAGYDVLDCEVHFDSHEWRCSWTISACVFSCIMTFRSSIARLDPVVAPAVRGDGGSAVHGDGGSVRSDGGSVRSDGGVGSRPSPMPNTLVLVATQDARDGVLCPSTFLVR